MCRMYEYEYIYIAHTYTKLASNGKSVNIFNQVYYFGY